MSRYPHNSELEAQLNQSEEEMAELGDVSAPHEAPAVAMMARAGRMTQIHDPVVSTRFFAKVDQSGDCWKWKGAKDRTTGYCRFGHEGRQYLAHRFSFALTGNIPSGLVVMHICDTPDCVRPDHLRLGTPADNSRDMVEKGRYRNSQMLKTRCNNGHELSGENVFPRALERGRRRCRTCHHLREFKYRATKKEAT